MLQLGVGHGQTLRAILQKEEIIPYGIDLSLEALSFLHNNDVNLPVLCADVLRLPFSDRSFDRIFEVGVVEHFYEEDPFLGTIVDREKIISSFIEARRVLKDEGMIAFIQPSKHSLLSLSQKIDQLFGKWEFGFQENFSINEFAQLLKIAGFKDVDFTIIQAPNDFPLRIRIGDRMLKSYYTITGQYQKAQLIGALFCMTAKL